MKLKNRDKIKAAALQLRKLLIDVDFGLQDSFCDSADLKASWENTLMPAHLLTSFSTLFEIPKHKLFHSSPRNLEYLFQAPEDIEADQQVRDEHSEEEQQKWIQEQKNHAASLSLPNDCLCIA